MRTASPLSLLDPLFPREQRLASLVLAFVLFLPWFLNPSWGPSPIVLQTALSAAAALVWFVLPPAQRGDMAGAVALSWLAAAAVNAAIAIAQYFGGVHDSSLLISGASYGEAYGNLRQRNQAATLFALGLAAAFFLFVRVRGAAHAGATLALGLAVALISAACALTSSRTGLLQWLILGGLAFVAPWVWGADRRWRLWGALALGSYLLALLALPALAQWWTGQSPTTLMGRMATDLGCVSRKVLWRNALTLIAQHPWAGWGLGEMDYAHHVTLYPGERFCLIVDNAHNLFLQVAVELGLPAAALMTAVMAWGLWKGRPWAERAPGRLLAWAGLGAVMLHSLVEYPLWYGPFELAALLALSLLFALRREPALQAGVQSAAMGAPASGSASELAVAPGARQATAWEASRLALCGLALAALAYGLWDYHRISQLYLAEADRAPAYRHDALAQARGSWLFASQVAFAEFTTTPLTPANARAMADLGERVMHYSPEPQVAQKLVEALRRAGQEDRAIWHEMRFRVAFPDEFVAWQRSAAASGPMTPSGSEP